MLLKWPKSLEYPLPYQLCQIVTKSMDTKDAIMVQNTGVDAIGVSNYDGRQLDDATSSIWFSKRNHCCC